MPEIHERIGVFPSQLRSALKDTARRARQSQAAGGEHTQPIIEAGLDFCKATQVEIQDKNNLQVSSVQLHYDHLAMAIAGLVDGQPLVILYDGQVESQDIINLLHAISAHTDISEIIQAAICLENITTTTFYDTRTHHFDNPNTLTCIKGQETVIGPDQSEYWRAWELARTVLNVPDYGPRPQNPHAN